MNEQPTKALSKLNENASLSRIYEAFRPHDAMISLRYFGEYAENAIFLGAEATCQWKIVQDSQGCWCLIPKTVKKQIDNS